MTLVHRWPCRCGGETSVRGGLCGQCAERRCAQCDQPGDIATLYSWTFEGKAYYICRDSVACVERQRAADEDDSEPEMLLDKKACVIEVSQQLLSDYVGMNDLIGKALRGEIEFKPPQPPKRHRCLACWLVSLLPGHEHCAHGYLESGCETCGEW